MFAFFCVLCCVVLCCVVLCCSHAVLFVMLPVLCVVVVVVVFFFFIFANELVLPLRLLCWRLAGVVADAS